ncbi:hypothetical protein GCM10023200_48310 [Actinomycetospora chlora]|uniref:Uncharacterized protein n=1 Tax=Actinomycetospora chlora TaxID=663608 RepID=A0ABP9C8X7_9PSEU
MLALRGHDVGDGGPGGGHERRVVHVSPLLSCGEQVQQGHRPGEAPDVGGADPVGGVAHGVSISCTDGFR